MNLADYIESNGERLIQCWKVKARARLTLDLEDSQLINSLPLVIEDLVVTLRSPSGQWSSLESAAEHGRQRVEMGMDIAGLTEELALLGETMVELAWQDEFEIGSRDIQRLIRAIGRATALSVQAYASMRDRQLADEAAQHFSFVAHEIRNPLNTARLSLDVLAAVPEAERSKHLDRINHALVELSEQVDNSMVEARLYGGPEMKLRPLDAAELAQAALDEVATHREEREITISREFEHVHIEADRKLLMSALTNILSNAVKFSHVGGHIRLRVRALDDRALFEVEDECGGLPDDLSQHLFQPFAQNHSDRSGFGLGLAIVKEAVEAHQGNVRVVNFPGKCCCFVLDIPRHQH